MVAKKLFTILLLYTAFFGYSQNKKNFIPEADIDITTKALLKSTGANAVSTIVYFNGKTISRHYGELTKGKYNRPNDNTLYEIGSVTKTFTGLLIAKAVTEGKVTLGDDIRKYLDGNYPNLEYNGRPITIKDLLVFKTGINRDFPDYGTLLQKRDDNTAFRVKVLEDAYTKEQFFADLKTAKLDTPPGNEYVHTKLGPELCAMILEKIYGKSYEQLLNDFLNSIGMKSSRLYLKNGEKAIGGFNEKGMPMPPIADGLWGAAGMLKATPADMIKYIQYHIDPKNVTAAESHRELSDGFAYCWNMFKDHEGKIGYWMHGGTFGTQNMIVIYPDYNLGISVIVNQNGPDTFGALDEARRALEDQFKPGKKSAIREMRWRYAEDPDKAIKYYAILKKTNNFYTDEDEINRYGYTLLGKKQSEAALQVFNIYVGEFPNSANAYDSRGEVYYVLKNYVASRKDYEKSLQLNPDNQNAREMLTKLKGL